jgi:hypothetical protein
MQKWRSRDNYGFCMLFYYGFRVLFYFCLGWYLLCFPSNLSLSFAPLCWEPPSWVVWRPPIKSDFIYIVHFLLGIGWTEGLKWRKSCKRQGLYIFGLSKFLGGGGGWEIEIEKFLWSFVGFPLVGLTTFKNGTLSSSCCKNEFLVSRHKWGLTIWINNTFSWT